MHTVLFSNTEYIWNQLSSFFLTLLLNVILNKVTYTCALVLSHLPFWVSAAKYIIFWKIFSIGEASWKDLLFLQKGKYISFSLIIYSFIFPYTMPLKCIDKCNNFLRNIRESIKEICFLLHKETCLWFLCDGSLMIKVHWE